MRGPRRGGDRTGLAALLAVERLALHALDEMARLAPEAPGDRVRHLEQLGERLGIAERHVIERRAAGTSQALERRRAVTVEST
ncbi:MAG: hypothetical protein E2O39_15915 [Planctomycetota bacterium]|nr:MAG: hypothetical protein E2O39_15915 [Planctomycetota bacterium]